MLVNPCQPNSSHVDIAEVSHVQQRYSVFCVFGAMLCTMVAAVSAYLAAALKGGHCRGK